MLSYSSIPHDCTDEYKGPIFFGNVASPPTVGNTTLSSLLLFFSYLSMSTINTSYILLDVCLPDPQCCPGIWRWWINVFFRSTLLSILTLTSVLFCISEIVTGNETCIPYDVLVHSFDICGTTISSLKFSPSIPLTEALFLVNISALIVCSKVHEKMVFCVTPFCRARETVTGCLFTTEGFLGK